MKTIIVQIESIVFEDEGFFIASCADKTKISGYYFESDISTLVGSAVTLHGEVHSHAKYGDTFKFETIKVNQNELFFFLNKVVKGFTKKLAADLIEKYGNDGLSEILDNDIEKLLDEKGISAKRLEKIKESWREFRSLKKLGEFLTPLGVNATLLKNIALYFKEVASPQSAIEKNPYILTRVSGIGFKIADEIALKIGLHVESDQRIASAMEYALFEICESEGNSTVAKNALYKKLDEMLSFYSKEELYESVLLELINEGQIIRFNSDMLSPKRLYDAEKLIFDSFKSRSKIENEPLVADLDEFLKSSDITLGDEQRSAVELINSGVGILCLVGYAGTGKSTTSRTILQLLSRRYLKTNIITCALSGIASQRIGDTTGFESATIQSLLMKHEKQDLMPYDVVLIDEASMINSTLFARLVSKISKEAIIIVVGDDAQLPPIGAGDILSDIITLELVPTVKLTKIYRQSENQAIALLANDIRCGTVPKYKQDYDDFHFFDVSIENYYSLKNSLSQSDFLTQREQNTDSILSKIGYLALEYIPKSREFLKSKDILKYINYFQVITPMRGGVLGVDNLNTILQDYFNPKQSKKIKKGNKEFRLMDKVIHIKNDNFPTYTSQEFKDSLESTNKRVFNGMNGLLFKIDEDEKKVFVFYPNEELIVEYEFNQVSTYLNLSYALTIHKVQGMEYDVVVIPMTFSHYIMHNTKLLYTAITRAKKMCFIVGETQAFESACRKFESLKRETVLLNLM